MALDFKAAMSKLKGTPGKGLHFFFCEQGPDGKPLLIVDVKKIPTSEQTEILKTAKKKAKCAGSMAMTKDGELELTPRGNPPTSLSKGVQIVARNANAMPKAIVIKEAEADEDDEPQDGPAPGGPSLGATAYSSVPVAPDGAYAYTYTDDLPLTPEGERGAPEAPPAPKVSKEMIARLKGTTARKFPDALRSDPKLAKLMDMKADAIQDLAQLQKKGPAATEKDFAPVIERLEKIDQALEQAQRNLNRQGVAPQPLGEDYKDEDKKVGWRHKVGPAPVREQGESETAFRERVAKYQHDLAIHESDLITTQHFSEQEREKAKVNVDAKGRLRNAEGDVLRRETTEFVMDREGQLHQFEAKKIDTADGKQQTVHHSSVLSGQEVTGAGGFSTDRDGKIKTISNLSGHYKPGRAQMIQTVEILLKNGALLDTEWTDANGVSLSGKAAEVYKSTMKLQKKIMEKLEDNPEADLKADLALIASAKKMLAKLGCGPSNRMSQAKVEFLEIKKGMTGLQVKQAADEVQANAKTVEKFLRTGGGSKADGQNKSAMQDELLAKTEGTRERLDRMADVRARRVGGADAGPGAEDLNEMAASLKARKRALSGKPPVDEDDDLDDDIELNDSDPFDSDEAPEDFESVMVKDPDNSGYNISVANLAKRRGTSAQALWDELQAQQGGGQPDFDSKMVADPDMAGYSISVANLAKRRNMSPDELWAQLNGGPTAS